MPDANPYAPPQAAVQDVIDSSWALQPASRGSRFLAAFVDGLLQAPVALPVMIALILAIFRNPQAQPSLAMYGAAFMAGGLFTVVLAVPWLVLNILFVVRNGQTIGKKIVGIKVVRRDGSRASLSRIFWLRNVVNLVLTTGLEAVLGGLGSLYSLVDHLLIFRASRQCLHDTIADTIVVNT